MHYDIAQFWPGGFQAKVTIVIKREVKFGWLMKLTFTSPVTSMEIFDAQVAEISEGTVLISFIHSNAKTTLRGFLTRSI